MRGFDFDGPKEEPKRKVRCLSFYVFLSLTFYVLPGTAAGLRPKGEGNDLHDLNCVIIKKPQVDQAKQYPVAQRMQARSYYFFGLSTLSTI